MAKILRYAARSDVGKVRSKNDDSAYAGQHLAVVADGMGGHAGGNIASASTVLDLIHLDDDNYSGNAGTALADEIQTANSLLSELVRTSPQLAGMGTTVTAILLSGDTLHFAHIGDSRAYRLKDGTFEQISVDHTFVQRLIDEGRLRPEEAETHPHKNVLMRVLGDVDASPELDLTTFPAEPGERWLLCSDGLNAVVDAQTIERTVRETADLQECVDRLVNMTLQGGSPDNVTVVAAEVVEKTSDDVATATLAVVDPSAKTASGTGRSSTDPSGTDSSPADPSNRAGGTAGRDGDPASGHLRADVLNEELASRPHVLVGAAATAAATGEIPTISERTARRRAATLLTHKSTSAAEETSESEPPPRRSRRLLAVAIAAVAVLAIAAGLWAGYAWTQTRYYVATYEGHVAIYQGISQDLGPISLSSLRTKTVVEVDSLPPYAQQRLARTVPAEDLNHAFRIVRDIQFPGPAPSDCLSPPPSPTATTPGDTEEASGTPTGDNPPAGQADGTAAECEGLS